MNSRRPLASPASHSARGAGSSIVALDTLDLRIADLGGSTLGLASGSTIWLDDNAAGWGETNRREDAGPVRVLLRG